MGDKPLPHAQAEHCRLNKKTQAFRLGVICLNAWQCPTWIGTIPGPDPSGAPKRVQFCSSQNCHMGDKPLPHARAEHCRLNKKTQAFRLGVICLNAWQCPTFTWGEPHTIIGAERFHYRVRDGIGWFPLAIATRQIGGRDWPLSSISVVQL